MLTRCPRSRRRLVKLGILAAPFLAWMVVILIVPTGWAKARLSAKLALATGRSVRIGSLYLGMMGQLRVRAISIADPATPDDPWFVVPEAQLDVHVGQVLLGHCMPGEVRLMNPTIRLRRDPGRDWECGRSAATRPQPGRAVARDRKTLEDTTSLVIEGGTIRLDDRTSGLRLDLTDVSGRATTGPGLTTLEEAKASLNGGVLNLAARLGDEGGPPRFEAEVRAHGVGIDAGLDGLAHLVPIVAGSSGGVRGRLDLHIAAEGRGKTCDDVLGSLRGNGSFAIDPVDLDGSKFLAELDVLGDWPAVERVGSLSCDFTIAGRRASTENLTLRIDRFPMVLSGWTDFDGRFDYAVRGDRMTAMLPRDARGWLKEAGIDFDHLAGIRVWGSPTQVLATIHGRPIRGVEVGDGGTKPGGSHDDERGRLRETARRIRERFFR